MKKVLFIGTRFGGTDGVSLETWKADEVLKKLGYETYYLAATLPNYQCNGKVSELFHFNHPNIYDTHLKLISNQKINIDEICKSAEFIKEEIVEYINRIKPDLISVQNALSIPMNLPLGFAITEALRETNIPAYTHNHDYYWERERYLHTTAEKFLYNNFPPILPNLVHVSINTIAQKQLKLRKNLNSILMPNVFDFDSSLNQLDNYNSDFKESFNIDQNKIVFLQPTRLVRRKGIEFSIELISKLPQKDKIIFVLTGYSGDEVDNYAGEIAELARHFDIDARFIGNRIADHRLISSGQKTYTLWDAFVNSDFVTLPSLVEGFCNHFTESCFFRKPMFINEFEVFKTDIKPMNFKTVNMDGKITNEQISKVSEILENKNFYEEIINYNFNLGKKLYSYKTLEINLLEILNKLDSQNFSDEMSHNLILNNQEMSISYPL